MHPRLGLGLVLSATLAGAAQAQSAADEQFLAPDVIVQRAWDAAGGLEAFGRLGILMVDVTTEEVAQAGKQTTSAVRTYFATPGPLPGRIEISEAKVVSGDDGGGGWALVAGKPDQRPSTRLMVKRLITTNTFALMLPFSLNWEGVFATAAEPTELDGVPVWRVSVNIANNFFHTPQISRTWTVDIHRKTYAVVQAQSPATDLGQGIKADGMRITWAKPTKVMGLAFPTEQRIIGLSETGAEKAHTRVDKVRYQLLEREQSVALFRDPTPPGLRPTPVPMRPPQRVARP